MGLKDLPGQLTRSSLGRLAHIGELYNIRDETLTSQSLFKSTLPRKSFETVDFANTDFNYKFTENISDKFDLLKLEGELQLGVLLKWITGKGSGEFVMERKESEKVVSCSLMCQIRTKQEKFFSSFEEILPHIDLTALRNPEYTHFVSEIAWGANCLLTLEASFKKEEEKKEIKGSLATKLSKLKAMVDIECEGALNKTNSKFWSRQDLRVKVHADVVPENKWPTTVEGFFEFLLKVPKLLENVNGGKGKPLSYVLTPLEEIRKSAGLQISFCMVVKKIDEGFITSTVCLFDEIEEMKRKLHDLHAKLNENANYVKSEVLKTAGNMKEKLAIQESKLRTLISENWVQVRSGTIELRDLVRQVEKLKNYDLKLCQYEEYLNECSPILKKLSTVEMYTSRQVVCLGKEETFTDLQIRHPSHEFIVLVTSSKFEENNAELCRNTACYFVSLAKERKQNTIYVFVDLDLTEENSFLGEVSQAKCFHFCGSRVVSKDLFANYLEEIESNFARPVNHSNLELRKHKPGKRVQLEIPCPGIKRGTCPPTSCKWLCTSCREYIEYGFDGNFYCSCGVCSASSFEYRCKERSHGDGFITAQEEFLKTALSLLRSVEEMNIVVLGQTGVGKSTWINSIVNYLTYDTMNSAKEHGVICTIPVRYVFHDPVTYKQEEIKLGEKLAGEESALGMSDTQTTHSYSFLWEGKCVRIIDTPGIGDTRGLLHDKENMKSIIEHLGYLEVLHGLCILVKANDARLNNYFSYCIKELLVHLPKSVIKNMVFCFTNSRGSLCTAGPGSALLFKLIRDLGLEEELPLGRHNMFTLDNEAFVFLCSLSCSDFKYSPSVVKTFEESWEMAATETLRLFNTVKNFEPHYLKETISLVNSRERILTLTVPLAEVGKTIQMNVAKLEKKEAALKEASLTIQELRDELFVDETFLEMKHLDHPQTVCTNKACVRVLKCNAVNEIEYHTICHHPCYLTNVEPKTVNNHALRGCDAMYAGYCTNCGCSWEEHMHLTYSQVRTTHKVKNAAVEEKIEIEESAKKIQENLIEDLKEKTDMYKEEQDFIISASVKFAMFLKNNAITTYNDSVEDYLKHLIREQDKIKDGETDEKILEGLKNTLDQYKQEVNVLQLTMEQAEGTEQLTVEEIDQLENRLYNLKLTGAMIKQCVTVSRTSAARMQEYRETPIQVLKKPKKNTSGGMMGSVRSAASKFWHFINDEDKKVARVRSTDLNDDMKNYNGCEASTSAKPEKQ